MFVTNWISTTKIQKISEITNFFRHYFLSRTEVMLNVDLVGGCASFRQALGRGAPPLGAPAGRPSGEGFIQARRRRQLYRRPVQCRHR